MDILQDNYDAVLIPGYIIVIAEEPSMEASCIKVFSILSLEEYQSPPDPMELWKSIIFKDVPEVVFDKIEHCSSYDVRFCMSSHASPLRNEFYNIWVSMGSPTDMFKDGASAFCQYTLYCPLPASGEPAALSLRSLSFADKQYPTIRDISYAGHIEILDLHQGHRVLALAELQRITELEAGDATDDTVEIHGRGSHVHVSAYSGALTYCTPDSVIVNYYQ